MAAKHAGLTAECFGRFASNSFRAKRLKKAADYFFQHTAKCGGGSRTAPADRISAFYPGFTKNLKDTVYRKEEKEGAVRV